MQRPGYGSVRFELTATNGTAYVIDCSSHPAVPAFKGATIYNDSKGVCAIYKDHLRQYGSATLVGATY